MSDPGPMDREAHDGARTAMRLGSEYLLRSLKLLGDLLEGEMLTAVVALGLGQANVAHLDAPDSQDGYRDSASIPPDELRRPISVLALATSLGLPYETTRRHVEKLVRMEICERVKGGVIIPARAIDNDAHRQTIAAHLGYLRRLVRSLKAAGVDLD